MNNIEKMDAVIDSLVLELEKEKSHITLRSEMLTNAIVCTDMVKEAIKQTNNLENIEFYVITSGRPGKIFVDDCFIVIYAPEKDGIRSPNFEKLMEMIGVPKVSWSEYEEYRGASVQDSETGVKPLSPAFTALDFSLSGEKIEIDFKSLYPKFVDFEKRGLDIHYWCEEYYNMTLPKNAEIIQAEEGEEFQQYQYGRTHRNHDPLSPVTVVPVGEPVGYETENRPEYGYRSVFSTFEDIWYY